MGQVRHDLGQDVAIGAHVAAADLQQIVELPRDQVALLDLGGGAVSGYGARVRARILANRPSASGVGRAVVTFGVASSGGLRFVRLARSSGDGRLDQAALAAVRRSSPFPTPPAGASAAQLTFTIGLSFR